MEDEKKEEKVKEEKSFLDSLIGKLNNGTIDRRKFLTLAGAAGITTIAATTLFGVKSSSAGAGNNCLSCHSQAPASFVVDPNTEDLTNYAKSLGIDLIWDRGTPCANAHKGNGGAAGLCCFRCQMGPCTLGAATSKNSEYGTCGASKDVIVARDLVRRIAGGAAAHVEHARAAAKTLKGVGNGTNNYEIGDPVKLAAIYEGLGCTSADGANMALAVANKTLEDLGKDEGTPAWLEYKANAGRKATWGALGILPTGAGAELSEALHRTTMGVDADMAHLATDGLKLGLVDGYCGLHPGSNIQDVLFGTPTLKFAKTGLSVIKADMINIIVNGHEPILSEKIVGAADAYNSNHSPKINVVGMCCTGNEVLMRKGVNTAGAMVQQEVALLTGAVEAMVVDVQCIIPNVQRVVEQRGLHTKIITTNPHAMITGATHIPFEAENAEATAVDIVNLAVANRTNRIASKVHIPTTPPKDIVAGFSVEQILGALSATADYIKAFQGDPLGLLLYLIGSNNPALRIRGIVGIVGCVTPRDAFGYRHVELTKRLIAKDILVVGTGCWSHAAGQYGLMAADPAYPGVGAGLKGVLQTVATACSLPAVPACWHMGSCIDNCRIEDVLNAVAGAAGVRIDQLPVAGSAPEFITEKAVSIGTWAVNLGLLTHIGGQPYVSGSANMVKLLTGQAVLGIPKGVETLTGGKFYVDKNPVTAAATIIEHINNKRADLGMPVYP